MKRIASAAGAAAALLAAASASAGTLKVTYVGDGFDVSFDQSSNPTPIASAAGDTTDVPVTNFSGAGPYSFVRYYSTASGGGFSTPPGYAIATYGAQLYSGSESSPTFSPGSFSLTNGDGSAAGAITFSVVPEPGTWGMMLVGFAGLGALSVSSRRHALAA